MLQISLLAVCTKKHPLIANREWEAFRPSVLGTGKGILGWVGTNTPPDRPAVLASKAQSSSQWSLGGLVQTAGRPAGSSEDTLHDIKIVVGNKALMAEEGITISKTVDEYMRDMEVNAFSCLADELRKAKQPLLPKTCTYRKAGKFRLRKASSLALFSPLWRDILLLLLRSSPGALGSSSLWPLHLLSVCRSFHAKILAGYGLTYSAPCRVTVVPASW